MKSDITNADLGDLVIDARKEIVFIEDNVPDLDTLLHGFGAGKEVVVLDARADGLQQIVDALQGRSGIDALHIISHGAAGALNLGALTLDAASLNAHGAELQAIGASLKPGADILLYGCDVGAGQGASFVDQLAIATGADVAASNDPTGGTAAGGDWELEVRHGDVEAKVAVDPALAATYAGVLDLNPSGPVTFNVGANFISRGGYLDPSYDVVYKVDGNPAYQLVFDGAKEGSASYVNPNQPNDSYVIFGSSDLTETSGTISFRGGQLFSISSLQASVLNNGYDHAQTVTLTGFRANGSTVSTTMALPEDYVFHMSPDMSAFTEITKLVITTTDHGGILKYIALDNLAISNIHPNAPDTTPPTVAITSDRATLNSGQSATITFTFSEAPTGFDNGDIQTSGGTLGTLALAANSGGKVYTATFTPTAGVNNGSASITVAAGGYTDAAGNGGGAGATPSISYDTLAPAKPARPVLDAGSDSGRSSTDGITSVTAPTVGGAAGSVEGGATVRVYDSNGVTVLATTTAAADGSWSIATSALAAGTHSITVTATDAAGNASIVSDSLSVTVDTGAPAAPAKPVLSAASDSGASSNDGVTNAATQTITGAAGSVEGGAEIRLYDGSNPGPVGSVIANADGSWSFDLALTEGTHTITAKAVDTAGNASAASTGLTLAIDRSAPAAPQAPVLAAASDTGSSNVDGITSVVTPTFRGSAESGATVTLYDTNGTTVLGSTTANADGSWSVVASALSEGTHAVSARATDLAGNTSAFSATAAVTIDVTTPATRATDATLSEDTGASSSDMVTSVAAQTISGKLDAPLAGGEHIEYSLDGGASWSTIGATAGATTWSVGATLSGSGTLQVRVVDTAGNAGDVYSHAYVLDQASPAAPSAPDLDAGSDTGDSDSDDITGDTTPTFSGTAEAGATVRLFDGAVEIGSAVAIDGTWHITSLELGAGTHDITAVATDAAGNAGPASAALAIQVVTDKPGTKVASIVLSADSGVSQTDFITKVAAQTISGTLDAALAAGEFVEVSVDGGAHWQKAASSVGGNTWSLAGMLAAGANDIGVRVTDAVGNSGAVRTQAYTLDTVAPTVAIASSAATLKAGQTASITFTFSEDPGTTFTSADITVAGGTLGALGGTGLTRTAVFTPAAGIDAGTANISIAPGAYADAAGNIGGTGAMPTLTYDTKAPDALPAPALQAASDTGTIGDGRTENTRPVIEGTATPLAVVAVYDGANKIGDATADAAGKWTFAATLGYGSHVLSATQLDAAGNESARTNAFALTIDAPPGNPGAPGQEPTLVDGMPVTVTPVSLPGGVSGSLVSVPVVTSSRGETTGAGGVADIPLLSSGGATLLLAQLPVGFGLSASGATVPAASGLAFLIASIKAATPTHAAGDQGHLTGNGADFLSGLDGSVPLLVETVKPISTTPTASPLVLSATGAADGQSTALVIDTGGLAAGSRIELRSVDFAAIVGAADITSSSGNAILSGDVASQHVTVAAGGGDKVFAGGGDDVLTFGPASPTSSGASGQGASGQARALALPAAATTLLHGGLATDTATFSGARADYDVAFHNGYVVVSSKAAPDAKALLVNVEQLQFGDAALKVESTGALTTLAGMYQTVLGRQADVSGFEFWADARDAGVDWGFIALHMFASTERLGSGGANFNGDATHDLDLLYEALFNRAPDAEGLAFWRNALAQGVSLEHIAGEFVESVEMVGHQRVATDWDFLV